MATTNGDPADPRPNASKITRTHETTQTDYFYPRPEDVAVKEGFEVSYPQSPAVGAASNYKPRR